MNNKIPSSLRTLPPTRQERLGQELADCAIAAEALARRLKACDALRTGVRQHAEKVAEAAYMVCEAAIAVNGCTQDLRMAFGQYIGAAALKQRHTGALLGEDDELTVPPR